MTHGIVFSFCFYWPPHWIVHLCPFLLPSSCHADFPLNVSETVIFLIIYFHFFKLSLPPTCLFPSVSVSLVSSLLLFWYLFRLEDRGFQNVGFLYKWFSKQCFLPAPFNFSSPFYFIWQDLFIRLELFLQCFLILEWFLSRLAFCQATNFSDTSCPVFFCFFFCPLLAFK